MVFFSSSRGGYGFGPMPGFNRKKRGTLSKGNWDRDPKPNRTDCEPFNFRMQEGGAEFLDVDDWNRLERKKLKFNARSGDKNAKKKLAQFKKEAKELFQEGEAAMMDSGDWYQ